MTFAELNSVRALKKQIAEEKQRLITLRVCAENIVQIIDGQPHKSKPTSRVEKIGCAIVDTEKIIAKLQSRLNKLIPKITKDIQSKVNDFLISAVLIYRYVACKPFKEISRLMKCSIATVFRKHRAGMRILGLKIDS